MDFAQITPVELKQKIDSGEAPILLDVREPIERMIAHIGGHHIPLGDLERRMRELQREKEIIVYCHHGNRSAQATYYLLHSGFTAVKNLDGGIDRWSRDVDGKVPRY